MAFFGPPPPFVGATTSNAGASGLVPAPEAGSSSRFLNSNSTFSEPLGLPKYKNTTDPIGSIISAGFTGSFSVGSPTIKVRTFTLIQIPSDGNIDELIFRTSAAPSPAYNVHIGLWQVSESGEPSSLIVGATGSTGTASSTDVILSISQTAVKTGIYFMSLTPDATGTANSYRVVAASGSVSYRRVFGGATLETLGNTFSYTCLTSYSQSNHETFGLSSIAVPLLGFRYA
jgi:hypothetical protein